MIDFYLKARLGEDKYNKLLRNPNMHKLILQAEKTLKEICSRPRPGAIISEGCRSKEYTVPEELKDYANYGNLILNSYFDDFKYESEGIISERHVPHPTFPDVEYTDKCWFETVEVEVDKDGGKITEKRNQKIDIDLAKQCCMPLDDWNQFWLKIDKLLPKDDKIKFVPVVKEPMLLSNLGGITTMNGKSFITLMSNEDSKWELAYLLGYKSDIFTKCAPQTKKISELKLKSSIIKAGVEIDF